MKKNNQNIQNGAELQGRTGPRTDRQILEKHAGVQEKVHGYMKKGKLRRIIAILSAFVLLFTLNTLKFKADTLQHLPMCGLTEHVHSEACYNEAGELVCGLAEHEHTDACYQQRPVQPEPTVFDEFMDLNSQVVLASPMDDEDVNISSENVDEAVGETSLDLDADGADFNAEADSFNGLEVEYDLEDLYDDSGDDSVTVDDVADNNTESEDNADEAETDYSLDGGSVAFLSDIMKAAGLGISGVTAVGEIVNDTFVEAHISAEPVEGVEDEYVIKVLESFDRVQLGVANADSIETVWLTNGQAVAAAPEASADAAVEDAPAVEEPSEPSEEIVEQDEEIFNSNEIIETEQKQTEVGEIETEVGEADVATDIGETTDAAPAENDESVTGAADASDAQDADDTAVADDQTGDAQDDDTAVADDQTGDTQDADDTAVADDQTGDTQDADDTAAADDQTGDAQDADDTAVADDQIGDVQDADDTAAADDQIGDAQDADDTADVEDQQTGDAQDADDTATVDDQVGDDQTGEAAVVKTVTLDFADYNIEDAHTVYLFDAEMGAVLVNTAEIDSVDGVAVTASGEEEAADEASTEEADEASAEEADEASADEGGVLVIEGDGEYALNGTNYVVTGLIIPGKATEDMAQTGDDAQAEDAPADEAPADDAAADGDQPEDDGQAEAAVAAQKAVTLDFTDYIATDEHAVYLYDASMVAVLVNEAEIASADGVAVTLPEEEAAEDAQPDAEALIITGDGEYALNGTTYVVTGLVLPEKTVENENITITTANDEATLLNVAPVFEETPEDSQEYQDIFSLFTEVKDDPKLLAKVFDLLGGVAYAEEDEDGRDLNVKVFRIGLEDVITGEAVEPGTELHVETSLDQPITGEDFSLYHIADGKAELIPDAVVVEDGRAVGLNFNTVSLDKFALVYYTVNVVVEDKNITVGVDFTDVVANGVDFDAETILTALNDGVAIDVASLLAGDADSALSVNVEGDALNVDVDALSVVTAEDGETAEEGVTYTDGSVRVTGDGSVVLTDGEYTLNIVVTNYTKLLADRLEAEGVSIEVVEGEVPAGSTVTYETLSADATDALVEAYIPEAAPAPAEEAAPEAAETADSGADEAAAEASGETVEATGEAAEEAAEAPADATDADQTEDKNEIETATGYTAFDVSVAMPEGDAFTDGGQFAVTVDHAVDAASLVPEGAVIDNITYELFHIHNGEATQIEDVAVANGQVSFTTDGFSEYVIRYTVEFHNGDNEVVIKGGSQVLLSRLIAELGLTRANGETFTVDEVEKVEFVNPELFTVEEKKQGDVVALVVDPEKQVTQNVTIETAHDFLLTSEQPFDADQMILTMTDGEVIGVHVTDDQSTLTTFIKFFAKDAEIIKKNQDTNNPEMHIIGNQEAPDDPSLTGKYYVLAVLKNKTDRSELGWAINGPYTLRDATTQVSFSQFHPFETQNSGESDAEYKARRGEDTSTDQIYYDKTQHDIDTLLYRTNTPLTTVNYYELVTMHAKNQTFSTPEEGYEFGGNFTNSEGTQNEIHLKKANNKKYKVRIYLDANAVDDITLADKYYLYVDVLHNSETHSYYYAAVEIDASTYKGGYIEFDIPHWMDQNGNPKAATTANNTFTGNEQSITVELLKYDNEQPFKPNNHTNATVNVEGSAIKAYKVHYDTKATTAQSTTTGYHEVETTETTVEGVTKTIVNCIDYVCLTTIDAEGQYNYASILGPNLNYGIVADHLYQENHLQTNFAVNHYTGHGHDTRPDLSGESGGQIVIAEYNHIVSDFWINNGPVNGVGAPVTTVDIAGQLKIGNPLAGTLVVYADVDSGAPGELGGDNAKVRGTLDQTVVIQTAGEELSANIVEPALHYMDNMSAELASHPATFVPPIPNEGKLTVDTKSFPDDATIFIDADRIKRFIGAAGQLIIEKKPDQTIIFNYKEEHRKTDEIKLEQFVVKQTGFPEGGYTTHSPVGTGAAENVYMDAIARHIVWNLYGVKGKATINISGGMFLQPNEDSVIDVKGTTAGWIVSEGLVSNGSGEWHNVFAEMPATSSVKLNAFKTVDDKQPRTSQKFEFLLHEYNTTSGNWDPITFKDKDNNTIQVLNNTGSIDFPEIKDLTTGWHVYRITENQTKPAGTNGFYIMDSTEYYAVVNVKTVTTGNNTPVTIVTPVEYYTKFTASGFDSASETLTGFDAVDKVSRVTFENDEITEGLNILKKVKGTAANNVDFTFKIELWYEEGSTVSPFISQDDITAGKNKFSVTSSTEGDKIFTVTGNEGNHSVGTITLKAGEVINFQKNAADLNKALHYRITETMVAGTPITNGTDYFMGYKCLTEAQEGTLVKGAAQVVFENEYKATGTLDLKAHKVLTDTTGTGKLLAAETFAFRLGGYNANIEWVWNDADGNVKLPTLSFTSADMEGAVPDPYNGNKLTKKLTYTVHEKHELGEGATNLAAQNVTYDDDKNVIVTLVDNGDGTITATAADAQGNALNDFTVPFNNTYEYKVSQTFDGTKVLTGRNMTDQEFWFNAVLTKYNDGMTETTYADDAAREAVTFVSATKVVGTNWANGTILFPMITFKQKGTYTFTVTEDEARLPEDVELTTPGQSYEVMIVVRESTDSNGEKILVAEEPTYTDNKKTINNIRKKMSFTVTKDWKDMAGANVNNGHSITFAVTKDGEAYSVTSEHIEKVAGTPGSFTVSEGKVTLIADATGWPTVKLKELYYPDTAAGYVVVEDAPTPSDENARVVVKYALNAGADADNCPAIAHNDAALVIKNIEEDNSTRLKVTKHYILPDGSDGNDTASKNPIYFAVKLHHNDNGWTSYYDNGSAINVGSVKGYQITWDSAKNEWTTVEIGEIPETVRVNENDAPVLKYEVVELDSNGQEKTTGDSLLEIKYYVNYGKATQEEVTPITQGQGAAITIENKIPQPRELTVTKAWVDEDGVALTDLTGRDTISFKLVFKNAYNGKYYVVKDANGDISLTDNESNASTFTLHGSIVEGEQVWETVTFKNLPYLSNASDSGSTGGYYVVETVGNGPEVTFVLNNGSTTTNIDESHPYDPHNSGTITIVNKEVDKSIKVKKVWIGPNPPDSIDVVLKYKYVEHPEWGEQTNGITNSRVVLNAANNWSYAWENLPESDSNGPYAYFVTEYAHDDNGSATNPVSGYDVEYSSNNGTLKAGDTVTITNTKQTTGIAVKKFWDDELELVKAPVDIALKEADCVPVAGALQVRIYDKGPSETEDTLRQTIYVKSGTDIVIEGGLIQGKSNIEYNPSNVSGTISGQSNEILTISNVTVAFDVRVTNGWGQGQQYNLRYTPDIEIDDNSVVEKDRVTLDDENNWYHEWTSNLNPDKYYFVEEVTPGYDVTYSNNNGIKTGLITATNSKTTPQYGSLKLTKEVKVNGQAPTSADQYALVDGSYTFTVTGPGSATTVNKAVVITINNGAVASATVDGSPVTLQEGYVVISGLSEGDYTVVEQAVTGMTTTVSGGTSTDPSTRTVTVHVTPGSTISPEATAVFTNNRNTVNLNIVKVDKDDTTKRLTGAKFKVMRRDLGSTADYQVFANSAFETNESDQSTGIVPVDDYGQITLSGLMPGEYQVSEVKAPAGYIILNSEFTFTIQTDGTVVYADGNNMVTYTSAEHKFEVKNEPGVSLPATGGVGTGIFYILGSVLTLLAAVLLITKRRIDTSE